MNEKVNLESLKETVSKIDTLIDELEKMQNDTEHGLEQYNKQQTKQKRGVK